MAERPSWLHEGPDGVELIVRVRPGATRSGVAGLHGGALCVRVGARPVEGAANRALLRVLAEALDVRPANVALRRGTRGRDKRVAIAGVSTEQVLARLAPLLR